MRTLVAIVIVFVVLSGTVFFMVKQQEKHRLIAEQQLSLQEDTTVTDTPVGKKKKRVKKKNNNSIGADEVVVYELGEIDSLAVHKADRDLLAFKNGELVKQYKVALGLSPVGAKQIEGDNKTPEGWYYIRGKNPLSKYYKSLGISYPNEDDKARAQAIGRRPGADIMIHGLMKHMNNPGKSHIKSDWTSGCVAVTDEEIDELFKAVNVGTPIVISP